MARTIASRRSLPLLILGLLAAVPVLQSCSKDSRRNGGASTAAPTTSAGPAAPVTTAPVTSGGASTAVAPELIRARFVDTDASGDVSQSDELFVWFDQPLVLQGVDPHRDLALVAGDHFGVGAQVRPGPAPEQVVVVLGTQPVLSLVGSYLPGRAPGAGASPATLAVAPQAQPGAIRSSAGADARVSAPVQIILNDQVGFPALQGARYAYPDKATAQVYYGNMHAHTGFSDGKDDPSIAMAHARDVAGLDFMVNTDHLEFLTTSILMDVQQRVLAEQRPDFITHQGFEWGHGYIFPLGWYNHINIIGTTNLVPLATTIDVAGLYREALDRCYPEGAVGQFNHVYFDRPVLTYNQWDDFRYDAEADKLMTLVRCDGVNTRQTPQLGLLPALAKGWHLSPVSNQDNHGRRWGNKNNRRTGVWMPAQTRAELMRALREGRVFSTSDKNAKVRVMANGDAWMGSTIIKPGPLALRVEYDDADGEGFDRVDIYSNGQVVASSQLNSGSTGAFELTVDPATDAYYYAHLFQDDGDELHSTPIYVDR